MTQDVLDSPPVVPCAYPLLRRADRALSAICWVLAPNTGATPTAHTIADILTRRLAKPVPGSNGPTMQITKGKVS